MMDVCDALEHVHEAADAHGAMGLVHRDLSPDNIIVSTSGSAKLIDFGAARATARTPPTPVFVGKYRYAAPERIRQVSEDRRSDVYSAGVILYECITGKRPFDGTDAEVIQAALASSRGCDPRARVPDVPARLAEVVLRATAPNPDDRFASARDAAAGARRLPGRAGRGQQGARRHRGAGRPCWRRRPPSSPRPFRRRSRRPKRYRSRSAYRRTTILARRRARTTTSRCARSRSSRRRGRSAS